MLTDAKSSVPAPGQKSVEKFLQNPNNFCWFWVRS